MAKIRILLLFFILNQSLTAQNLRNFKTKNEANTTERTYMLDLLRAEVREEISQKVVIVVNHFIVSGVYAWIEGSAQLKDGSKPKMPYNGILLTFFHHNFQTIDSIYVNLFVFDTIDKNLQELNAVSGALFLI